MAKMRVVHENIGEKPKVSKWLLGILIFLAIVMVLSSANPFLLVYIIIAWFCASKCADLATETKRNINLAFCVGYFFSLFGLFFYWIYCRTISKTWKKFVDSWGW